MTNMAIIMGARWNLSPASLFGVRSSQGKHFELEPRWLLSRCIRRCDRTVWGLQFQEGRIIQNARISRIHFHRNKAFIPESTHQNWLHLFFIAGKCQPFIEWISQVNRFMILPRHWGPTTASRALRTAHSTAHSKDRHSESANPVVESRSELRPQDITRAAVLFSPKKGQNTSQCL